MGIKRKSNLDYYLLTEKEAGTLGNLPTINGRKITTLFKRDGSGTLISTRDPAEMINFPTRIIYNEKLGEYGLIIVSNDPNQKIGNPDGWSDGVFVIQSGKSGRMFFNAMLTGPSGRLLSSNFFNPYDGNGKFIFRSFNDLKKDFADSQYEHLHIEDSSNSKYGTRVFMVFSQVSSNYHVNTLVDLSFLNPCFAQDKDVHYEPSIMEDPIHPDLRRQLVWYRITKEARTVEPICVRDNIDGSTMALAYAFSTLMRNIIDPIIPSSVIHHSDDLVITNDVFKIGSDGDIEYSLKYFREDVMNKLNPSPEQLKKINPISITADGVSLEFNEEFTRKEFYRTYFELLWQHRTDPAFKEYFTSKWLGENPALLSSGDTVLESDVMIMRKIDAVLQRIYGHVGLTLIKLGVLKFRRIGDKNFEVRATALDSEYLKKIVVKWQIKSLRSGSLNSLLKYFSQTSQYKEPFIISCLLSGISQIFKVDDGTGVFKECSFSSLPNIDFQERIFKNLDKYTIYDFKRYTQISSCFLEKIYPKTFSEYVMTAQLSILDYMSKYKTSVIDGRYDYLKAIWRVIDEAATNTITQEYFDTLPEKCGYKSKNAFLFHSIQRAKLDFRNRLFQKGTSLDSELILPFRRMISQNLGYCELSVGSSTKNMFLHHLSIILSREYLGDDLNKYVPMTDFYYNSFVNHPEMVDIWDSIYKIKNIWEEIKDPIWNLKNYLEKELRNLVFNSESEAFMDDKFEVSFYVATPSGIDYDSTLKQKFGIKTKITFTRADLDRCIWGIIYYMVAFDSTIIIREAGGKEKPTILSMSLLGGLITPENLDKESVNFRVYPLGKDASEKYEGDGGWTNEIREIVKNMPLYPIQLLSDAENLAKLFNRDFNTGLRIREIRFLEKLR
ncbi:hypothetical protein ES703_73695 [subsurface metagenome]